MSISQSLKKINTPTLGVLCVVLGALLGLGIFKIEAISAQKEPVFIDSEAVVPLIHGVKSPVAAEMAPESVSYVASKSGTKYHLLTCPGAKTIVEKNRIYFKTEASAQAAGYTPAANCKGLQPAASNEAQTKTP
jgi:hypothetical protein